MGEKVKLMDIGVTGEARLLLGIVKSNSIINERFYHLLLLGSWLATPLGIRS